MEWWNDIQDPEVRWQLCTSLTLLLVIINGPGYWYAKCAIYSLGIGGFVLPKLRDYTAFWLMLGSILVYTAFENWAVSDNHKWLMGYWCLALTCAVAGDTARREILGFNARCLMVAVMGIATLYKLTTDSYTSGAFFEFTLLTDHRFADFASWATDLSKTQLQENQQKHLVLITGNEWDLEPHKLHTSVSLRWLALFMTWWTICIEGGIAIAFMLPEKAKLSQFKHILLLVFAATTYLVAPVPGFGCLLMLFGMSQCLDKNKLFFALYCFGFIVIEVSGVVGGFAWISFSA